MNVCREGVNGIEDRRQVVQQSEEDTIEIGRVPEEDIDRRKDHADSDAQDRQAKDREDQRKHMPAEIDVIDDTEQEIYRECQHEIHKRRNDPGKDKQILRDVDLLDDIGVSHQSSHAVGRRFPEVGHDDISGKQIDRIMRHRPAEKMIKDHAHDEQCQQRIQHAP